MTPFSQTHTMWTLLGLLSITPHTFTAMWTYRVTWPEGEVTSYTYPRTALGDCLYDRHRGRLICKRYHGYRSVVNTWLYDPELIVYLSVRCRSPLPSPYRVSPPAPTCMCRDDHEDTTEVAPDRGGVSERGPYRCQLQEVSPHVLEELGQLEVLDLADNVLRRLEPSVFVSLRALKVLSLADNPLPALPEGLVCPLAALEVLNLKGLHLTTFPAHVFRCDGNNSMTSSVRWLDVSGSRVEEMPAASLWYLSRLEFLNVSHNLLHVLPAYPLLGAPSLTTLSLSHNLLHAVPRSLCEGAPGLLKLLLGRNRFTTLPLASLDTCRNLTHLDLTDNALSSLPPPPASLPRLQHLCLSRNRLTSLNSPLIAANGSMITLDLSHNDLRNVSSSALGTMTTLVHLDLRDNSLSEASLDLGGGLVRLSRLQTLDLSRNQFSRVSGDDFEGLTSLLTLDLSQNRISRLILTPNTSLTRLTHLNLSANQLTSFPARVMAPLVSLRVLDVSRNQLHRVSSLHVPGTLLSLDVSRNSLQTFPRLLHAKRLHHLDLSLNAITHLGQADLQGLSELRQLSLAHNYLGSVHTSALAPLRQLQTLQLAHNRLALNGSVSTRLFSGLRHLNMLNLSHNHLFDVEVLFQSHTLSRPLAVCRCCSSRTPCQGLLLCAGVVPVALPVKASCCVQVLFQSHTLSRPLAVCRCCSSRTPCQGLLLCAGVVPVALPVKASCCVQVLFQSHSLSRPLAVCRCCSSHTPCQGLLLCAGVVPVALPVKASCCVQVLFQSHSLASLLHLDVSYNAIGRISRQVYRLNRTMHLQTLSLEGCRLREVSSDAFRQLIYLRSVNLRNNRLTHLPLFRTHPGIKFHFHGNPLTCDCHMSWLKHDAVLVGGQTVSTHDYDVTTCRTLPRGHLRPVRDVNRRDFLCYVSSPRCPASCSCYSQNEAGHPEVVFCAGGVTSLPSDIPPTTRVLSVEGGWLGRVEGFPGDHPQPLAIEELYLNNSGITELSPLAFQHLPHLLHLQLDRNHLQVVPAHLLGRHFNLTSLVLGHNRLLELPGELLSSLEDLKRLDLSHNSLTALSVDTVQDLAQMRSLRRLQLSNNPWRCDCANKHLHEWVRQNLSRVYDHEGMFCEGDPGRGFVRADPGLFDCREAEGLPLWVVGVVFVGLPLLILIAVLAYRFRRVIAAILYSRLGLQCVKPHSDYLYVSGMYDATILYDHSDRKCRWWVEQILLPRLTSLSWRLRVHVSRAGEGARGEEGGGSVVNSAVHGIRQSAACVVLVSKHFGAHQHTVACLHQALLQAPGVADSLVLVTWGELTKQTLECGIRPLLGTARHLPITAPFFWDRLLYLLPAPHTPPEADPRGPRRPSLISGCRFRSLSDLSATSGGADDKPETTCGDVTNHV
ncbi:hypothetical protein ACOMHN_001915 [Nucella lapillus]